MDSSSFFANEHEPVHVHIVKGNGYAKINLIDLRVIESCMKNMELKRALEIVLVHQADFVEKWYGFFNKR